MDKPIYRTRSVLGETLVGTCSWDMEKEQHYSTRRIPEKANIAHTVINLIEVWFHAAAWATRQSNTKCLQYVSS